MKHKERLQLARDLCQRMADRFPVLIGGVYGSTARGTDTPWSDLELWFVVENGCQAVGKHFLFQGISAHYDVYQENDLLRILTEPDGRWPFHIGILAELRVLYGDPERVAAWLLAGQNTPAERFYAHLEEHLPELVVESYGRIHSSARRDDFPTAQFAVTEVLFEMQNALCLLNQRWVTRDYDDGLMQVAKFPDIPTGYAEIVPALRQADDFDKILPLADRLVEGFLTLIADKGIQVSNYKNVESIPL